MHTNKLIELLRQTWASPVFGDSYPVVAADGVTLAKIVNQVKEVHHHFVTELKPILARGMPEATTAQVAMIVHQIASKSTAFCAAIAAGEIHDVQRLCAAAVSIALVYWADQSMDRGDEAMLTAVGRLGHGGSPLTSTAYADLTHSLTDLELARLTAVQQIEAQLQRLSRSEDISILARCVFHDTLSQEARFRELSQYYLVEADDQWFWATHADEVARLSIENGALIYVTAAIYAIYRHHRPELPGLREIFGNEAVMSLLNGPCNAAIRVFDDLGDRYVDSGAYPEWGEFSLNVFNHPNPRFLHTFLHRSGIEDRRARTEIVGAFILGGADYDAYIVRVFVELVRERMSRLPAAIWQRYGTFLALAKRVVEAGYVNTLGDMALAENFSPREAATFLYNRLPA